MVVTTGRERDFYEELVGGDAGEDVFAEKLLLGGQHQQVTCACSARQPGSFLSSIPEAGGWLEWTLAEQQLPSCVLGGRRGWHHLSVSWIMMNRWL